MGGVKLSPCGADGIREIFYDLPASFTCWAEGGVQWRLQIGNSPSYLLSSCSGSCVGDHDFDGLFTARVIDSHTSTMTINPLNSTTLYRSIHILNGSLECARVNSDNMSTRCGLDYVRPPDRVECRASAIAWSVNVSCNIEGIFSLRGIYNCQLIQTYKSENSVLQNVTIVTSPTSEKITENKVKVSGVCRFNATLPPKEGTYSYSVSISLGGRKFSAGEKWFTVERPRQPIVLCYPQPYVLENTEVNCTCSTTSPGQPAGLLTWIISNQTRHRKEIVDRHSIEPRKIFYTQTLTLSDHDITWFRCDVIWRAETETFQGNNYTAQVVYAARTPRLFPRGRDELLNQTVMEGDRVDFVCESQGRPTPTVHIYNQDNDTKVWNDSSPANYIFIARCKDTARYKCFSKNAYSTDSNRNASAGLDLYVRCKPRDVSVADFGMITFGNQTEKLNFDLITYPVPHKYAVWFVGQERNNTETMPGKIKDSEINVTCKAHVQHRYLSSCTLTIFSVPFYYGFYKIQVANEHGDQNFTVEISYDNDEPPKVQIAVFAGGAAAAVFSITIVVLIVVTVKTKRKVELLGVNFTCPTLRDGVLNTVSCTINRTALTEAGCIPDPESVVFDHTVGSTTTTLCFVTIFDLSACSNASTLYESNCWCDGYQGDVFEYRLNFLADQTRDAGAQLECKTCWTAANHLDVSTSESCKNMSFEHPYSQDGSNCGHHVDCTTKIIVGCCIGIMTGISITVGLWYYKRSRRRGSPANYGCTYSKPTEEH